MYDVLSILGQMAETSGDPRVRAIVKALDATGKGTDLGSLTNGGALRVESIEKDLAVATVKNDQFRIYNKLFAGRQTTWSLIDQKLVQDSIGGFPGSSVSNETGTNIPDRNGAYRRLITELKLFSEKGSITLPAALQATLQNQAGVVNFTAQEQEVFSSLTRMLASVEWGIIHNDVSIDSLESQGLVAEIKSKAAGNVIDMGGGAVKTGAVIAQLASRLSAYGKFGAPDVMYVSPDVKSDLDGNLEPSYRVNLDGALSPKEVGAQIKGVRYNALSGGSGLIDVEPHIFLDEALQAPKVVFASDGVSGNAPASVTSAKTASDPNSKFLAGHAGPYFYAVEAAGAGYCSQPTVLASAQTVAAGDKVTLTISQSSGGAETYYNVYRGRLNGTNAPADMRFIGRVKKAGATTTFDDLNKVIPGTSNILMLTTAQEADALAWLQMIPPAKIPMAMTALNYVFQLLYIAALRVTLPKKHGLFTNVLPSNATWKPFA